MSNSHSTSTGTMTMLAASTAVVTNPFLPNFNQPHTQAGSALEIETTTSGATPIALTAFTLGTPKKTNPAPVSLAHSPDVSTFCSAACCTQAGKSVQLTKPSDRMPSDWTQQPLCQRKMQLIYDELPLSHSLLSIDSVTLKERLGRFTDCDCCFCHKTVCMERDLFHEGVVFVYAFSSDFYEVGQIEVSLGATTMTILKVIRLLLSLLP